MFAQFGADIDSATAAMLRHGERLMQLLVQPSDRNYLLSEQVFLLFAASNGVFERFERRGVVGAASRLLEFLARHGASVRRSIDATGRLTDSDRFDLIKLFERFAAEA